MGLLECPRCLSRTEAKSIEEGRLRLDHSLGRTRGKPCYDGLVPLNFTPSKNDKKVKKEEIPAQKISSSKYTYKKIIK